MPKHSKFTEPKVYTLIKEIRKHECLWNPDNNHYQDMIHTAPAWLDISTKIGKPVDLIKMKWKNLRDGYKKEIKKYNLQSIDDYIGTWQYFEPMKFLDSENDAPESPAPDGTENFVGIEVLDTRKTEMMRRDDEKYDIKFMESLLPFFRELEPVRKLAVRRKMQDMLMNELSNNTMNDAYN